ncbi:MAG: ABC transporter permease [Spirochaetes bacterium]|nr:ABC transporter permease [Spirochaetota bacterium]
MKYFKNLFYLTGKRLIDILDISGFTILLLLRALYFCKNAFSKRREIFKQMYIAGVKSFIVCSLVAIFIGMILSLQVGIELQRFQQQSLIGDLLITTMTREMGPLMTGIIIIASVGSAMAAEIGTMKVSEEIDALEMMSISPVKFLVMPRLIALAVMVPISTIYVIALGTIGGAIVAYFQLNVPYDIYYNRVVQAIRFKATYVGIFKSFIFGIIIAAISCSQGLKATNGALGVGKATRSTVVASFLMVLIVGYFITSFFYGK